MPTYLQGESQFRDRFLISATSSGDAGTIFAMRLTKRAASGADNQNRQSILTDRPIRKQERAELI